jgi:hypothetical protein
VLARTVSVAAGKRLGPRLGGLGRRVLSHVDPVDLLAFAVAELGRLRPERFRATIRLGFEDPAVTAQAASFLAVAGGVLAPLGELETSVDWSGEAPLDLALCASVRVVPLVLCWDALRFTLAHVRFRVPAPAAAAPAAP